VTKAADFPLPDARLGERVCLAIVPRPNASIAPMDLLYHLNGLGLSRRLAEMVRDGETTPRSVRWQGLRDFVAAKIMRRCGVQSREPCNRDCGNRSLC
jgi:hypothetical protein